MRPTSILRIFVPAMTLFGYVFLFVPLIVLVAYAFNRGTSTVVWEGFSLAWFKQAFDDVGLRAGLLVSVIVTLASAILSTAIGAAAAIAVVKRNFLGKNLFSTLVIAPLILPEIVLAVGLLVAAVWTKTPLGYGTLIAGHVLISVPFSFLIIRAAATGLDARLDEAAADLGASGGRAFLWVTLPLLLPAIVSAFLLCAVISFDDFIVSTFMSGVGTTPLPIRIYSMLKNGLTPKINALGTMLIAVNVVAVLLVLKRYPRTTRP